MRLIKIFTCIFIQLGEHLSSDFHIVSVNKRIPVAEIILIAHIHENCSQFVVICGKRLCQIFVIICTLHNRIADDRRLVEAQPCHGIRIFLHQFIEIHLKLRSFFHSLPNLVADDGKIFDLVILLTASVVRNHHHCQLIRGKHKHTKCDQKHCQ